MSTLLTKIPFWKMHGAGNDFVVLDALSTPLPENFDFRRVAERLCVRHFGVGSDGLLLLEQGSTPGAAVRMRMWNPDGSEDMCGNGLRCVAQLARDNGHILHEEFTTQTLAGLRQCKILGEGLVRVEMGAPQWEFSEIPMQPIDGRKNASEYSLHVAGRTFTHATSLSTGSTHTVIFLDEDLSEAEFQALSPQIENHEFFPERTTVLWTRVLRDNHLRVRIWERGGGETLACGTGACAVACAAQITGRAQGLIQVESRGGVLGIELDSDLTNEKGRSITMTGPTRTVFSGGVSI